MSFNSSIALREICRIADRSRTLNLKAQSSLAAFMLIAAALLVEGCQSTLSFSPPRTISSHSVNEASENAIIEVSAGQVFHRVAYIDQMSMPATMQAPGDIVLKYSFELTINIAAGEYLAVEGATSIDGRPAFLVRLKDGRGNMKLLVTHEGDILPKLVISQETLPYSLQVVSGPRRLASGSQTKVVAKENLVFAGSTEKEFRFLARVQDHSGMIVDELSIHAPRREKLINIRGHRFEVQADSGTSLVLRLLSTSQDRPKLATKIPKVSF